ncbi:hypothetical protein [Flavihumibacter solisilvae]|uniref:Carbohydrate-binding family V/XII n=1 Tax=Flavihumibacter solisilvae TaxID=1349421 RepID=A0A0C1IN98_9BACT|nr:hypothetical protein [Flavihumibacter solisilvae]KIC95710.1 hypothetical protein OI18_05640 [Flavihumibacter solisilvae]
MRYFIFILLISLRVTVPVYSQPEKQGKAPVQDIGWPRQITQDGSVLVLYQPQVSDWKDYTTLTGNVAFAITPKGGKEAHGVASFECNTLVDKQTHTAYMRDVKVSSIRFPGVEAADKENLDTLFRKMAPPGGEPIAIERLMAELKQNAEATKTVEVKNDPPPIFYSTAPAIMLMVEGEPVYVPISKTELQFVVNTNWDLFYDKSAKVYYLLAENTWLTSKELKGPWKYTKALPNDMSKLPDGENFDEVKKMIPPPASPGKIPEVFFSNVPAELILFKGAPVYTKIVNTELLYVANTENDVFVDNKTKTFFVLLSGRWFSADDLKGPWYYAGNSLPSDFARIPSNSPKAAILASVPGTVEAADAVMLAQVPTTAIVNKKEAAAKVKVVYDGKPEFKKIESTGLEYASNTQDKVIRSGELYYLCYQAVWFVSSSPDGPWETAESIPAEIYSIPASSPVYNVTYVTQTVVDEETVQSNAAAGFFGSFVIGVGVGVCLAYGTGWYYPPYMYYPPGMMYPVYRPYPCTYGAGFAYNPYTGGYAGGRRVYGPYGAAGTSAWYNPSTGRYGRSASVQGPYGGRTAARAYNPWTGGYAATSQGHNAYGQWGSSVATRGGEWAQTGHVTTARGTTAAYRTSTGQQGVIHSGQNGKVIKGNNGTFVGHDGNIYKKNEGGNWSQYDNGSWKDASRTSPSTRDQLDRSATSRQRGEMQTRNFQNNYRSMGAGRRGGGGGFRRGR